MKRWKLIKEDWLAEQCTPKTENKQYKWKVNDSGKSTISILIIKYLLLLVAKTLAPHKLTVMTCK